MAPAAYGAFIVHPPILVALAFAVQPLPVPAELKFLVVLFAGVAGSFGLTALARRAARSRRVGWVAPWQRPRLTRHPASSR
jgi:peptidoglycan/LPS O-acetylase OafA/YrhL